MVTQQTSSRQNGKDQTFVDRWGWLLDVETAQASNFPSGRGEAPLVVPSRARALRRMKMNGRRRWEVLVASSLAASALAQNQQPILPQSPSIIPPLGFGTWRLGKYNASEAVSVALQTGYNHLDCAAVYGNEKEVGQGIIDGLEKSGHRREEIWITSKLWNDHHDPDKVRVALDQTLRDLGLDYLDLYLMHWPVASHNGENFLDYLSTWKAMEALLPTGKVRHVGVSNFSPRQLDDIISNADVKPAVHQFELHPYLQQTDWVEWHHAHGISVTAYSPLANANPVYGSPGQDTKTPPSLLENKEISDIAQARRCTNAQVALAWGIGRGTSVIPKSQHADRIRENFESTKCELKDEDYRTITAVGKKYLHRFNKPGKDWGVPLYEDLDDADV
ncbi:MAG: hypothetical protein Q9217_005000 [Psora testacea]